MSTLRKSPRIFSREVAARLSAPSALGPGGPKAPKRAPQTNPKSAVEHVSAISGLAANAPRTSKAFPERFRIPPGPPPRCH